MKANHNDEQILVVPASAVFNNAKIQKWKLIAIV